MIRIERNNEPLSLSVLENFMLKMLGFSEWIEVHGLAAKNKSKANDILIKNLKAKFEWIKAQARKLGIPPPPELSAFGLSAVDKKRKRSSEILKEVFFQQDIIVDGMHRNLVPPQGVVGSRGLRNTPDAEEMYKRLQLAIEARDDLTKARKVVKDNLDGLGIHTKWYQRVKKELLSAKPQRAPQTYSSQRHRQGSRRLLEDILVSWDGYQLKNKLNLSFSLAMLGGKLNNTLWYDKKIFELKPTLSTKLVKVVNSWQNYSLMYGRDVSKNGRALNTSYVLYRILDTLQLPPTKDATSY
ncbi:hypothetical protein Tco_0625652 [Tanacetum coccineum]|uniref:Uncharacterized protein n=1 Tax=Tanacetum coccineum TaxID=301880 RepID=A0ABQ4WHD3_9ASTR